MLVLMDSEEYVLVKLKPFRKSQTENLNCHFSKRTIHSLFNQTSQIRFHLKTKRHHHHSHINILGIRQTLQQHFLQLEEGSHVRSRSTATTPFIGSPGNLGSTIFYQPCIKSQALEMSNTFPFYQGNIRQPEMSDSDDDYIADEGSDNDIRNHQVSKRDGNRSSGPAQGTLGTTRGGDTNTGTVRKKAAWEDIQRSWDSVVEGADGSINSTVQGLREAGKRKRSVDFISFAVVMRECRAAGLTFGLLDYYEIPHHCKEGLFAICVSSWIFRLQWWRRIYDRRDTS